MAWLWIIVLAIGLPAAAQEKFVATVDQTTLRVGESLTLTLTFSGGASGGVPAPVLGEMENLKLAGGPFSSTSVSMVNGRVSSSASYSYVLRATKAGLGRIGPAKLSFRGKEHVTNSITVQIVSGAAGSGGQTQGKRAEDADVFLRVVPDKTEAYVGEQITLTYRLYFAAQITNPDLVQLPNATGFWVEEIPLPHNLPVTDEVLNGKAFRSAVIRKSALFPTASGDLEVEPLVISTKVERVNRRRSRDPFDIFNDPFFQIGRQMEPMEVASPSLKLKIKPLPQVDVPPEFAGAVGSYKLTAALDSTAVRVDHAVQLTVRIEGTGNIKTLPPPKISIPADIERFDPETSEDIRKNQPQISGSKTFKYVLIPRAPGLQIIPAVNYPYFDAQRGKYVTISTPELRLNVEKGDGTGGYASGLSVATKYGVENIATDIAFVKTRPGSFVPLRRLPHQGADFWVWSAAPWAILGATVLLLGRRERKERELVGRKGAVQRASRELAFAAKALKQKSMETVLRHLDAAVDQALQIAVDSTESSARPAELREIWQSRGLDPILLDGIMEVQLECDRARFAAGRMDGEVARRMIERLRSVLNRLSRATVTMESPR